MALVVLDGVICRETAIGAATTIELLCPEDVLLPPAADGDHSDPGAHIDLTVVTPARLIVLSRPFIRATARWPVLLSNLNRRVEAQRHRLVIQASSCTSRGPRTGCC